MQTLGDAIASSTSYDTIVVKAGEYQEYGLEIIHPLVLIGLDFPIVDGNNQGEIFKIVSDSVTIKGFEIRNVNISYTKDLAGINVVNCDGCKILDNNLTNTFFGIYLQKSKNCVISGNRIKGEAIQEMSSGNAIHLWYCSNIEISNNICIKHRDGIYLEFVDSSRVESNISEQNIRYGLHFMFSNYDEYLNNSFIDNGSGVAVMFSKFIKMHGNNFKDNWGNSSYGLLLKDITDSDISQNIFHTNTTAIYAESATRVEIVENDFMYNGWALKMLGSSMYNSFKKNNLIGNTIDITTNSKRNTNDYEGNYWSVYTGYDLDKDGYGDVPHKPVQLFSYLISQVPEAIVLVRSPLVDLLNFVEDTTPIFTPEGLEDIRPAMKRIYN